MFQPALVIDLLILVLYLHSDIKVNDFQTKVSAVRGRFAVGLTSL
jgi:hypothetical protein